MCVIWCQSIHVLFFISKSCKGIVLFIQDFNFVALVVLKFLQTVCYLSINELVLTLCMGQHENALFDSPVLYGVQ